MFTQVPRVFYQHPRRCHHRGSSWWRTVHVQFASHTLHWIWESVRVQNEMIWNEWNDMKWKKSSYARIPRCPKWCDTLWHMWHSALRNVQAQGLDFTVLQIMVRMHWMRSWNRKICSSVWHEPFVNLLDRKSTKRGIAGIASCCAQYFTVLPLLRRGQWEVWWRSCRGPSIRFHDDRL